MGRMGLRRTFAIFISATLLAGGAAFAQVDVGNSSRMRNLVPAAQIENAAGQQYSALLAQAREKRALAPPDHPQLKRLREISSRLIAQSARFNPRARVSRP